MDDILGESHSTSPEYVFNSTSMTSPRHSQSGQSMVESISGSSTVATAANTCTSSEDEINEILNSSKRGKRKPGKKGGNKMRRTSGACQMIAFLEKYTEQNEKKEEEEQKRREEERKRAEDRHYEQIKVLQGLSNILEKNATPGTKK
ncbi:hypothetical protein FSP39_005479 [Pinctada imbricata]|uniref:Uncharacterized protein n=1 Tax=Pinctada imbricata TaxID=66713 RepID=A0AA89C9M4_PINIB|nr:hypothetical protein FSP39_005479 [Pinctada imbricata]